MTWGEWFLQGWEMYTSLHPVALTLLSSWVFWMLYVYTMGLYRARLAGRLKGFSLILASPAVAVAFAVDVVFQVTVFSIAFLDPPRDFLVTDRLRRYLRGPDGWRKRWAEYFCHYLLDPFDPTGMHCDSDPPKLKGEP
jgi:hypothetical protein